MYIKTAVSLLSTLGSLADFFTKNKENIDKVKGVAGDVSSVIGGLKDTSIQEISKPSRIEPLVLIDESIVNDPYMLDLLSLITVEQAAYYSQALTLIGDVGGMSVIGTLDRLNPNRTGYGMNELDDIPPMEESFGLEDLASGVFTARDKKYLGYVKSSNEAIDSKPPTTPNGIGYAKNTITDVYDVPNLVVGKHFEVNVSNNGITRAVAMTVRLLPITTDSRSIAAILSAAKGEQTMKERWHMFKAGELTFSDLWGANDLIEQQTKTLIRDKSGFYQEALRRVANNRKKGFLSGNPSLNTMANIVIIPATTARLVEQEIGGNFGNMNTRQKIFDAIASQLVVVVDSDYGLATFYLRGERVTPEYTFAALKSKGAKSNDADLVEIFKLLSGNK